MARPDNHQNADLQASARKDQRRKQKRPRRSRHGLGLWLLILTVVCGAAWYFARPHLLVYQAKSLLSTNPQKAAELLEDVVASSGDSFPDAQVLWSRALLRSGRRDEAVGCLSQITPPAFADSTGLLELADEAGRSGTPLLQVMSLEAIQPTDARRAEAIDRLIPIRQQSGDHARTLKLAQELARLQPTAAKPWLVMARTHEQLMSLPDAVADYGAALERDQSQTEKTSSLRALVRILIHLGDRDNARRFQNQLTQLAEPRVTLDQINEARLQRLEGNSDKAWNQVAEILTQDPDNTEALELRATISMERREYSNAEADLRKVISRQPWNKQAHYKLAQTRTKLGDAQAAASHFAENRRLLGLSNRIVDLQRKGNLNKEETAELINALEQTGMQSIADTVRQRSR